MWRTSYIYTPVTAHCSYVLLFFCHSLTSVLSEASRLTATSNKKLFCRIKTVRPVYIRIQILKMRVAANSPHTHTVFPHLFFMIKRKLRSSWLIKPQRSLELWRKWPVMSSGHVLSCPAASELSDEWDWSTWHWQDGTLSPTVETWILQGPDDFDRWNI